MSTIWRGAFPDEYRAVQAAARAGSSWISMECLPESMTCATPGCCEGTFAYAGLQSSTYCDSMNRPRSRKKLNKPLFLGAGIILPPKRPGWKRADLAEIASLIRGEEGERVYDHVTTVAPHLTPDVAAQVMMALLAESQSEGPSAGQVARWVAEEILTGRRISSEKRKELADRGMALPDGSYCMETVSDLRNAIRLARAGHGDVPAAKRLITRMAKKWGRTDLLPEDWKVPAAELVIDSALRQAFINVDRRARAAVLVPAHSLTVEPAPPTAVEMAGESGVIVCAVPPEPVREALAALGTETPDEIHLTIAFLGRDEFGAGVLAQPDMQSAPVTQELVAGVVAGFTAGASPLHAKVSGLGRFALEDGSEVTYASVDAPGLPELYSRLVAALEGAGVPVSHEHGLSPHISLRFGPAGSGPTEMPQGLEWEIDRLALWWGGYGRWEFTLAGGAVQAEA